MVLPIAMLVLLDWPAMFSTAGTEVGSVIDIVVEEAGRLISVREVVSVNNEVLDVELETAVVWDLDEVGIIVKVLVAAAIDSVFNSQLRSSLQR
jgi:hypothetical protein